MEQAAQADLRLGTAFIGHSQVNSEADNSLRAVVG